MTNDRAEVNLFVLSTGFHFYFSTLLIDYLQLDNVAYAMYQPREGIERRAAERHRVCFADRNDPMTRWFSKKVGKWFFAGRAFRELDLRGRRVRMFSPYYNDNFVYSLRRLLERHCTSVEYDMLPDGGALLRPLPGKPRGSAVSWLHRLLYGVEPASSRHMSGSFSPFLRTVYHFAAANIQADPAKVHIVPVPPTGSSSSAEVLVLGGLGGINRDFVRAARSRTAGRPVRFRMHPKNRSGIEYIAEEAPDWVELQVSGVLEEHLLAHPYELVIGPYSSAVVFNHLLVPASRSEFIIERAQEDPDYHATADACGIPVTIV
jgi:hypothetical protein